MAVVIVTTIAALTASAESTASAAAASAAAAMATANAATAAATTAATAAAVVSAATAEVSATVDGHTKQALQYDAALASLTARISDLETRLAALVLAILEMGLEIPPALLEAA